MEPRDEGAILDEGAGEHEEETNAELEALEAIFDTDFVIVEPASSASGARFEISLSDADVVLRLVFTHPRHYLEEPIAVVVHALEGLSSPRRKQLQLFLEAEAAANVGFPVAFALSEAARGWLAEHVIGKPKEADGDDDEDAGKFETLDVQGEKVEVIASKAIGNPVTVESFAVWREQFMAEIAGKKSNEQLQREQNTKLTGRQMFESKLAAVSVEAGLWEAEAEGAE